jgi:hypothetical protein
MRNLAGQQADIAEAIPSHLIHRPGDRPLQSGETAQAVAYLVAQMRQLGVTLQVRQSRVDELVRHGMVLSARPGSAAMEEKRITNPARHETGLRYNFERMRATRFSTSVSLLE